MSNWTAIFDLDDIPPLGARTLAVAGGHIAVFRTENDVVYAIEDSCPHRQGPLSQGIVHGAQVTCPLHNWVIDLATGSAVAPDVGCVARYDTRLVGATIEIDLDSIADKNAA